MKDPRPTNRIFSIDRFFKKCALCFVFLLRLSGCPILETPGKTSIHESDYVASITVDYQLFNDWHQGSHHIVDGSSGDDSPYESILKEVYKSFHDNFDIIFLISNISDATEASTDTGYYGLLISDSYTHMELGLAKLKGIIHLPFLGGLDSGPSLHEILHLYANFSIDTYTIISMDDDGGPVSGRQYGHWGFTSTGYGKSIPFIGDDDVEFSMGGQLGGFSTTELIVIEEPGSDGVGTWRINGGFGSFANEGNSVPYADLELYLMGLEPQNNFTEAISYFSDFMSFRTEIRDNGIWYTGRHYTKK